VSALGRLVGSFPPVVVALVAATAGSTPLTAQDGRSFALVIHGGGGSIPSAEVRAELEAEYRAALADALEAGYQTLLRGGTSVDAVEAAIRVMEDSPYFNAGKGASFNRDGVNELDASIMDGSDRNAGAAAIVRRVKNPITLARTVMERSPHLLMAGDGADRFAQEQGLDMVPHHYFFTDRRWQGLQRRLREGTPYGEPISRGTFDLAPPSRHDGEEFGTVGAVAVDIHGNLAAGTSTGGRVGKLPGRVGDSPIIGAGTYADNRGAAVSSTGLGELVLRVLTAKSVSELVRAGGMTVQEAVSLAVAEVREMGGQISLIALDRYGSIGIEVGHDGMYRGYVTQDGRPTILIWDERDAPDSR
jgi:L-asparaginase / beta-aspartyl-peptidase